MMYGHHELKFQNFSLPNRQALKSIQLSPLIRMKDISPQRDSMAISAYNDTLKLDVKQMSKQYHVKSRSLAKMNAKLHSNMFKTADEKFLPSNAYDDRVKKDPFRATVQNQSPMTSARSL